MKRYLILIVLVALTSGCVWYTSGPPEEATLSFEGSINASDDGFRMEGNLNSIGQNQPTFENVSIDLYDRNGTRIHSTSVGTFESESPRFSIRLNHSPEYIVFYSDEFWKLNKIEVMYYARADTSEVQYTEYVITSREELPIVPNTAGVISTDSRSTAE